MSGNQLAREGDVVWAADDGRAVFLTEVALRATTERFGTPRGRPIAPADVPAASRLLYGAGMIPAWGEDAAPGRLANR